MEQLARGPGLAGKWDLHRPGELVFPGRNCGGEVQCKSLCRGKEDECGSAGVRGVRPCLCRL